MVQMCLVASKLTERDWIMVNNAQSFLYVRSPASPCDVIIELQSALVTSESLQSYFRVTDNVSAEAVQAL